LLFPTYSYYVNRLEIEGEKQPPTPRNSRLAHGFILAATNSVEAEVFNLVALSSGRRVTSLMRTFRGYYSDPDMNAEQVRTLQRTGHRELMSDHGFCPSQLLVLFSREKFTKNFTDRDPSRPYELEELYKCAADL